MQSRPSFYFIAIEGIAYVEDVSIRTHSLNDLINERVSNTRVKKLSVKENIILALPHKIIAAAITGLIYALLLAMTIPYFYESNVQSSWQYVEIIVFTTLGYMLYSHPVILLYGSLTSIVSD